MNQTKAKRNRCTEIALKTIINGISKIYEAKVIVFHALTKYTQNLSTQHIYTQNIGKTTAQAKGKRQAKHQTN